MEGITYIKRFGIIQNGSRYAVVTEISEDGNLFNQSYEMNYARAEFALAKAEKFVRRCHRDFTNFQGIPVHFEFVNMGLIQRVAR
jgi:hypothetical protein